MKDSDFFPEAEEHHDAGYDGEDVPCQKCLGSGFYSDCFDDMCHGNDECIHGDDATCSECGGEGFIR